MIDWHEYFINLTEGIALKSKDRSVKIGAIIVGPDHEIRSSGFNGFPRGVDDHVDSRHERPIKYYYTEHAERNAIYNAARCGIVTRGTTLYLNTGYPCADCARAIIQAGIVEVIMTTDKMDAGRWKETCKTGAKMLREAGVKCTVWEKEDREPVFAIVNRARAAAYMAHEGQKRKGNGEPFIVHPKRVYEMVRKYGSPVVQAVCWLHDVEEDTSVTVDDFPPRIRELVRRLTQRKDESSTEYLRRLRLSGDGEAILIKVADRMDNIRDGRETFDDDWMRNYLVGAETILIAACEVGLGKHTLTQQLIDLVQKMKKEVE